MNDDGAAERPLSAAQQWTAWEREVLADGSKVAPLEVEEATVGNGWPWRSWRVSGADLVKLDGARWEWATACAWGASFTRAKAAESVAAFGKWRGREWRNGVGRAVEGRSPKMVEAELRNALEAGTVKAWAFQGSRPVTIPAAEWPALEWRRDEHGETLEFADLLLFGEPRYRRVTISRAEVIRLWPARDGWAPVEVVQAAPPGPVEVALVVEAAVEDAPPAVEEPIVGETLTLAGPGIGAQAPPQAEARPSPARKPRTEKATQAKGGGQRERRAFIRQFDAEHDGKATSRQTRRAVIERFSDRVSSGLSTIAEDLAAVRAEKIR